ncbi:MAG: DUF4097 family beta strand repeat protein [Clostridia bacterium]|nr:DUF4097 family beta strand repeat protein [Clostridia bacterium]
MGKSTKIWLISASALVLVGILVFTAALASVDFDITKLSNTEYVTNEYSLTEDFESIFIEADTADIIFKLSKNGENRVVCRENKKTPHTVKTENGSLTIDPSDNREWYDHINIFSFGSTDITLYLTETEYENISVEVSTGDVHIGYISAGELDIETSTGDIGIEDIWAGNIDIKVSTGDVTLTDISCDSLKTEGDTGDIMLKTVVAEAKFDIKRSTGDVKLEGCDAEELRIETDTGDVVGTLLSEKIFITESDTGRIDVPETTNGGRCEITTDTGDIKIDIPSA